MGIIIYLKSHVKPKSFSLMSPLVDKMPEESPSSFTPIRFQRPLRTSEPSALEKKVLENQESHFTSRDQVSTESLMISWPKEEISLEETEPEVSQSTVRNSQMRTSP